MKKTEAEMQHEFYELAIMPCCGGERGFYNGSRGGDCTNIMCGHCGATFNIGPREYIQQIGEPDTKALAKVQASSMVPPSGTGGPA